MSSTNELNQANIEATADDLKYGVCWFCKNPMQDNTALNVNMYGNVDSKFVIGGLLTRYNKHSIKVPRCKRCRSAHWLVRLEKASIISSCVVIGGILGLVLGLGVNKLAWNYRFLGFRNYRRRHLEPDKA